MLQRLVTSLRLAWPDTRCIVRGDRHFGSPEGMQGSEAQAPLHAVTGLTGNAVCKQLAGDVLEPAKRA